MTYRLNPDIKMIVSPVILMIGAESQEYPNGAALAEIAFEKNYLITTVSACEGKVILTIEENTQINDTSWSKEEVSFFE